MTDAASQPRRAAVHGITSLPILRPAFPRADSGKLIGHVVDAAVGGLLA